MLKDQVAAAGPSTWQPEDATNWTEHVAPDGRLYWHNHQTKECTFHHPSSKNTSESLASIGDRLVGKITETEMDVNERPRKKKAIPGTDGWFKVRTNFGNIFYAQRESQRSEWIAPEEIRAQVKAMEITRRSSEGDSIHQKRMECSEKIVREDYTKIRDSETLREVKKRKRRDEEEERSQQVPRKNVARSSNQSTELSKEETEISGDSRRQNSASEGEKLDLESKKVNAEQFKEKFLQMLSQMNGTPNEINPMAPWDKELPKFIDHPDYSILKDMNDRQDAFNEWCRLRLREKRTARAASSTPNAKSTFEDRQDPDMSHLGSVDKLSAFRNLLETEITSTRTSWEDFRKSWKRDRRFFAFGRDDRDREKEFRNWLKELGEKKRKAAIRNENEFIKLLHEKLHSHPNTRLDPSSSLSEAQTMWSRCKKMPGLDSDPRYEAVGSSSRRAELFEEWAKGKRNVDDCNTKGDLKQESQSSTSSKKHHHDANNALKQREEEVARKRRLLQGEKTRTLGKALYEESVTNYRQLLIDAIRDPLASFEGCIDNLSRDDRFHSQTLSQNEKQGLFYEHVEHLNQRRLRSLQDLFEKYAPTLDSEGEIALPLILNDEEIDRKQLTRLRSLSSGSKTIEDLFDQWQADRESDCRNAFLQMLKENAFVDFWGRLRQEQEKKDTLQEKGEMTESLNVEKDEDTDAPDLLQMASTIDLDEIHAVLKNDQRYRAFHHKPQMREEWIRDYLQQMEVPKKTVFQH